VGDLGALFFSRCVSTPPFAVLAAFAQQPDIALCVAATLPRKQKAGLPNRPRPPPMFSRRALPKANKTPEEFRYHRFPSLVR
jgi:hypothetical protein